MRTAAALVILAALVGCSKGAGNGQNVAGNAGLPMPGPRPTPVTSVDAGGGPNESGFRQSFLRANIQSCIESANATAASAGRTLPAADLSAFCTCGIGRAMAGLSDEQVRQLRPGPRELAIREQCAADHGLAIDDEGLRSGAGK